MSSCARGIVEAIVGFGHPLVAGDHQRGAVVVIGSPSGPRMLPERVELLQGMQMSRSSPTACSRSRSSSVDASKRAHIS